MDHPDEHDVDSSQPDFSQLRALVLGSAAEQDSASFASDEHRDPLSAPDHLVDRDGVEDVDADSQPCNRPSDSSQAAGDSPPTSVTKPASCGERHAIYAVDQENATSGGLDENDECAQAVARRNKRIMTTGESTQASDGTVVQSPWIYAEMTTKGHGGSQGQTEQRQREQSQGSPGEKQIRAPIATGPGAQQRREPSRRPDNEPDALHSGDRGYVYFNLDGCESLGRENSQLETQLTHLETQATRLATQAAVEVGDVEDEDDEDEPMSPVQPLRTQSDRFPEEKRFYATQTPVPAARKRKYSNSEDGGPSQRPPLPANPFGSSALRAGGPMGLSQAFKNTQAPTSPLGDALPSSERPSPNFAHLRRLSAGETTSSPARLQSSSIAKSARPQYRSSRPMHHHRGESSPGSSPSAVLCPADPFDELEKTDEQIRQHKRAAELGRLSARRELSALTARSSLGWPSHATQGKSSADTRSRHSSPIPRVNVLETTSDIDVPEDSEAETEYEELSERELVEPEDAFSGEENKENHESRHSQVPEPQAGHQIDRSVKKRKPPARQNNMFSFPSSGEQGQVPIGSRRHSPHHTQPGLQDGPQLVTKDAVTTIADSQEETNATKFHAWGPQPQKMTEGSSNVVKESQSLRGADSSEPSIAVPAKQVPRSSSILGASSPPSDLKQKSSPSIPPSNKAQEIVRSIGALWPARSGSTEKFSSSERPARRSSRRSMVDHRTPLRQAATQPNAIPETVAPLRPGEQEERFLSSIPTPVPPLRLVGRRISKQGSQETSGYLSAQTHKDLATQVSLALELSSESQQAEQCSQQPRGLLEITNAHLKNADSDPVDLSFNVMNEDDQEFMIEMEKLSSPLSPKRKRGLRSQVQVRAYSNLQQGNSEPSSPAQPDRGLSSPVYATSDPNNVADAALEQITPDRQAKDEAPEQALSSCNGSLSSPISPPSSSPVTEHNTRHMSKALEDQNPDPKTEEPPLFPRVFAHWPGKGLSFYPATCLEVRATEPRFRVRFDYDDEVILDVKSTQVKRLEVTKGDHVRVDVDGHRTRVYVIDACFEPVTEGIKLPLTDIYGNRKVKARSKPRNKEPGEVFEFPISAIYHESQTWKLLKNRDFSPWQGATPTSGAVMQQGRSDPRIDFLTPASKRRKFRADLLQTLPDAVPTSVRAPRSSLFNGMVFVLTHIGQDLRSRAVAAIVEHGGKILKEGFEELFEKSNLTGSAPSSTSKRSVSRPSAVQANAASADIVAQQPLHLRTSVADDVMAVLVTDHHCRVSKYFEALALGVPCISTHWIHHCVDAGALLPWRHFLLAAGESSFLGGAIISRSLRMPHDTNNWPLKDMLAQRPLWLDRRRVLLVGIDHKNRDVHMFLARTLGAAEVATANSIREARKAMRKRRDAGAEEAVDFVIVNDGEVLDLKPQASVKQARSTAARRRDRDEATPAALAAEFEAVRVVSTEFVMQSLILGKIWD